MRDSLSFQHVVFFHGGHRNNNVKICTRTILTFAKISTIRRVRFEIVRGMCCYVAGFNSRLFSISMPPPLSPYVLIKTLWQ